MILLTVPAEAEWQEFLDSSLKLPGVRADAIRKALLEVLQGLKKGSAASISALWGEIAGTLDTYAQELGAQDGEPPCLATLFERDHLWEVICRLRPIGDAAYEFELCALAVTGLLRLLDAQDQWTCAFNKWLDADALMDAASLEREIELLQFRQRAYSSEKGLTSQLANAKGKLKGSAEKKNAQNKAWRSEFIAHYDNYKKSAMKKLSKYKTADFLLDQFPHIEVEHSTAYRWILDHEAAKKPQKMIEHL